MAKCNQLTFLPFKGLMALLTADFCNAALQFRQRRMMTKLRHDAPATVTMTPTDLVAAMLLM